MKRIAVVLVAILVCLSGYAIADYSVADRGEWPKNWPQELEPLREHARTLEGPLAPQRHYAIHFNDREEFESAWPHLLKIKGEGQPLVLSRGDDFFLGNDHPAGVIVHSPLPGQRKKDAKERDKNAPDDYDSDYYLVLVVDGDIVDLNRIPLPSDTPIQDRRFDEEKNAPGAISR